MTEICLLSGVHPGFTLGTFIDMMHWIHEAAPGVHIHAFSPDEVAHAAKKGHIPTPEVIARLKLHGVEMTTLPEARTIAVEMYRLVNPKAAADRFTGNPSVSTRRSISYLT